MKVLVLSDLHLEFGEYIPEFPECDVVILAGDIHIKGRAIPWIKKYFSHLPVIYIFGNHEFYGDIYPRLIAKVKASCEGSNIHVLENESLCLDGYHFLGCTLWTDFALHGDPKIYGQLCQTEMNDFRKIRRAPTYSKLRSVDAAMIHKQSLAWLKNDLQSLPHGEPRIVISHHAPSARSLPLQKKDRSIAAAYASHLDDFVLQSDICLWAHGHIHTSNDYKIGSTRVVCNPRGYTDKLNSAFNQHCVVEI